MRNNYSAALVVTTINTPKLLEGFVDNFKKYDHMKEVLIIVVPDEKTPSEAYSYCESLSDSGAEIRCPDLEEQEKFLKSVGIKGLIPRNSDNRRNVGFLMAVEENVDFLMSIDDDNYCLQEYDFYEGHSIVTGEKKKEVEKISSSNGWFNICELLETDRKTYPRGFPYRYRHQSVDIDREYVTGNVSLNEGMWIRDPDVDAISWLVNPTKGRNFVGESFVLSKNTWAPVNTQNTSLESKYIPAYYFIPMQSGSCGTAIDRYGDIFSGYYVQKIIKENDESIRFGTPVLDHDRNSHNYLKDAYYEMSGLMVLEDIAPWLRETQLDGNTVEEMYISLSHQIQDAVENFSGPAWNSDTRGYFHRTAHQMREWISAIREIKG